MSLMNAILHSHDLGRSWVGSRMVKAVVAENLTQNTMTATNGLATRENMVTVIQNAQVPKATPYGPATACQRQCAKIDTTDSKHKFNQIQY